VTIPAKKWGWAAGLAVLLFYVGGIGFLGSKQVAAGNGANSPLLPESVKGLLLVSGSELIFFVLVFGLFLVLTHASSGDLRLGLKDGLRAVRRGILYSIALRAFIAIVLLLTGAIIALTLHKSAVDISKLRPQTENLIDFEEIAHNPLYFALTLTLVSFVLGGIREELWRSGVLTSFAHLFPRHFAGSKGQMAAVLLAAVVFGFGHLPQGWGGVYVTGLLGTALGWIMVRHDSIWEAVLAHGFFDASTFALLYLLANYFPASLKGL
jgi:membrane protease YdiL (CAAX protease family)